MRISLHLMYWLISLSSLCLISACASISNQERNQENRCLAKTEMLLPEGKALNKVDEKRHIWRTSQRDLNLLLERHSKGLVHSALKKLNLHLSADSVQVEWTFVEHTTICSFTLSVDEDYDCARILDVVGQELVDAYEAYMNAPKAKQVRREMDKLEERMAQLEKEMDSLEATPNQTQNFPIEEAIARLETQYVILLEQKMQLEISQKGYLNEGIRIIEKSRRL